MGRFDEEWAKLDLAPMIMRGKADLPEASIILTSVKPELTVGGTLQIRTMLPPFGYEEVKVVQSAGSLVVPKFPDGARDEEQGPSSSGKNPRRDDGQGGIRRSEEPMQQDSINSRKRTIRLRQDGCPTWTSISSSTLKTARTRWKQRLSRQTRELPHWNPPSAFMGTNRNLSESSSPSNSKNTEQKLLMV